MRKSEDPEVVHACGDVSQLLCGLPQTASKGAFMPASGRCRPGSLVWRIGETFGLIVISTLPRSPAARSVLDALRTHRSGNSDDRLLNDTSSRPRRLRGRARHAASDATVAQAASRPAKPLQDPRTKYTRGPFKEQRQEWPALTCRMEPRPDHGETSYHGSGQLAVCKALITGVDSGIGRAVAIAFAREGGRMWPSTITLTRNPMPRK